MAIKNATKKIQFVDIDANRDQFFLPETPFTGKFVDVLPQIQKHKAWADSSHAWLTRLIMRQGIDHVETARIRRIYNDETLYAYNAFGDFYGLGPQIHSMVVKLRAAASGAEQAFQILFMVGPPSGGKSQIANRLKYLMASGESALYLKDSVMRSHPLTPLAAIPVLARRAAKNGSVADSAACRKEILRGLNLDQGGINFKAHDCKAIFAKLRKEPNFDNLCQINDPDSFISALVSGLGFNRAQRSIITMPDLAATEKLLAASDPVAAIRDLAIDAFDFLDERQGSVGIASVKEVEPLKYDQSVMIGEDDVARFGEETVSDAQMVLLNGAYNRGHRGIVEFVEAAKNTVMAFRTMLDASQDKSIPAPAPISNRALGFDGVIIAHTNQAEMAKFLSDKGNAPYKDRFLRIDVTFPTGAKDIERVLDKMYQRSEYANSDSPDSVKLEPTINPYFGKFLAFTRQKKDLNEKGEVVLDPMTKIRLYDGETVRASGGSKVTPESVRARAGTLEGMDGGTNRFATKIISELAANALLSGRHSISSREVIEALKLEIKREMERSGEAAEGTPLADWMVFINEPLARWRAQEITKHFLMAAEKDAATLRETVCGKYMDVVDRLLEDEDSVSSEDRKFVEEIESTPELSVTRAQSGSFHEELRAFRSRAAQAKAAHQQKHGYDTPLPHSFYEPLARAIDRWIALRTSPAVGMGILRQMNAGDKKRRSETVNAMIKMFGYDEFTAEAVCEEIEQNNYLQTIKID